ncbi:RICIN domain-containing protein [Streptomyces sp. Tue6028]|uniref:RICIN domain-containing protein n=1 Tax=Streptomyces sp. Tue6028 TaxID=2036037 RepID=UPI003D729D22
MPLDRRRFIGLASLTVLATTGPAAVAAASGRPSPSALTPASGGLHHPNAAPLHPSALLRLPVTAVRPRGWLAGQLRLQLDGLSGRYDEISHFLDRSASGWTHPDRGGWEEVPYWLRGFVDLAIVTGDADALARARRWIEAIVGTARSDGFFGPEPLRTSLDGGPDFWPFLPLLQALRSWQEYTGDDRIIRFLTAFLRYMHAQGTSAFDRSWVSYRWGDGIDTAVWLYNRTGDAFLLDLVDTMHEHGADWTGPLPSGHNVNIAQGFREPAQYAARSGSADDVRAAYRTYDSVMGLYGQFPGGGFAGDENVRPGFTDPRQGFETCGIVELMASHELLTRLTGDPVWADRCEDLAFNALPAALDPQGRAVHYITSANCVDLDNRPKTHAQFQNGFAMQSYRPGVDQYRCCPHNYGMGWPWFTQELWTATPDRGLCATLYAPCEVTAEVADSVRVGVREETDYPFGDTVTLTVSVPAATAFPLLLRVPGWCPDPSVTVNGQSVGSVSPGPAFVRLSRTWRDGDVVRLRLPQRITARTWERNGRSVSIDRGPLTYALRIGEEHVRTGGSDTFPEYDVHATTPWNYGLATTAADPTAGLTFASSGGTLPDNPFTQATVPHRITAPARRIPEWRADDQRVVEPLQPSPALSTEPVETVTLIPLGAARLRISALPIASPSGTRWTTGGAFFRLLNRRSGKALGVDGMSHEDSAQVVQFTDNGTADHQWQLVADGGWYLVRNANSGKVLGVDRMSHDDDARVVQFADNGTADHQWQLVDAGDGWYRLRNRESDKVLGVLGGSTADSAPAVQRSDDGADDRLWRLLPDGPLRIENRNSGKVLAVSGMSHEDSAQVVQFADNGTTDHLWTFLPDEAGWYRIRNENSGKVLGVDGMSHEDSAHVVQFTDNGTADHQWRPEHDGDGFFRLRNRNSGKVLGLHLMSREDSAQVVQFTDNGTTDHQWRLL